MNEQGSGEGELASVTRVPSEPGCATLVIRGEVDISNVETIREAIEQHLGASVDQLVLDLTGVEYLDSQGIRLLYRLAARPSLRVTLVAPRRSIAGDLIAITNLGEVVNVREP